jgi:hypothetical protein
MAMTRLQIVTEIGDAVGKTLTASAVSGTLLQDRIVYYLNAAQRRIARYHSFYELNGLKEDAYTADTIKTYPLETGTNNLGLTRVKDINTIRLIDSANSIKLKRWHHRKFDIRFPRPENYATGRPTIYTRWGNNLELFRIPNATYTLEIRYTKWAQDLATDAQVSDFVNKDELLIAAGIFETYLALEEYTDAQIHYPLFLGKLKDAAMDDKSDIDWEPVADAGMDRITSGEPWLDPYGTSGDPLGGYAD